MIRQKKTKKTVFCGQYLKKKDRGINMGKKPEVRMSEGTAAIMVLALVAVVIGSFTGWYGLADDAAAPAPAPAAPAVGGGAAPAPTPTPLQLIPAIEKTKLYLSTYDQADFDGEQQKNRVAGTAELIKSGVSIDTVTTATSGAAASTAEFNGGDMVLALGDATNYYASASAEAQVSETLQPFEVFIRAAGTPTVAIEDDNGDAATTMILAANEISKAHTITIERPGDDTFYQLCGVAANYNDEVLDPKVKVAGSYEDGLLNLDEDFDALDAAGYDAVWEIESVLSNFDEFEIDFLVGTEKDVDPSNSTRDCCFNKRRFS
jgi:hypothetical protein